MGLVWLSIASCIALIVSFLSLLYVEYRSKSPFIFFPIGASAIVLYPHLLYIFNFKDEHPAVLLEGTVYILVFNLFLFIFRFFSCNVLILNTNWDVLGQEVTDKVGNGLLRSFYFLIALTAVLLSLYAASGSFNVLRAAQLSWWDFVNASSLYKLPAIYLFYFLSALVLVSFIRKDWLLGALCFLIIVYFIFVLRTRSYVVAYMLPVIAYGLFSRKILGNKFGYKKFLVMCSLLVALSFIFFITREVRLAGGVYNFFYSPPTLAGLLERNLISGGDFALIEGYYYFLSNSHPGLNEGANIIRTFMLPVPSFLAPGLKPGEFTYLLWDYYKGVSEIGGQSFHPTIYGMAFADLRWVGVWVYPLVISFTVAVSEFFLKKLSGVMACHAAALICLFSMILARGAFYNAMAFLFWPMVLVFLMVLAIGFIKRVN